MYYSLLNIVTGTEDISSDNGDFVSDCLRFCCHSTDRTIDKSKCIFFNVINEVSVDS